MELVIKDLTKKYGSFMALDHVNMTFQPGVYGILGANGAGKSTLMNLITDNLKRSSGEILYDGKEILKLGCRGRIFWGVRDAPSMCRNANAGVTATPLFSYQFR